MFLRAPQRAVRTEVFGSIISSRHDEQPRADLKPGALRGFELDSEAQLTVLEEKLRDASHFRESLDVADRQHRRISQSATTRPA